MVKLLLAIALLLPVIAAASITLLILFNRETSDRLEKLASRISLSFVLVSLLLLAWIAIQSFITGLPGYVSYGEWFGSGKYKINLGFTLDGMPLITALVFELLCWLTIRFSVNYMHRENGFHRFFLIMNLFTFAMLLIVLGGSVVMTFVGWELAGFSSFMLIGYAADKKIPVMNANRAFITNRIGDACFILGIFLAFSWAGAAEWHVLAANAGAAQSILASLMLLALVIAAMAKSAQIPFSPWITRALEGPTPSSAIFYGALLVHAGVYLLIRMEPVLVKHELLMLCLIVIGVLTSIYGVLGGLVQSDIKSSLIFATLAQVGLMFVWCGLGWFQVAGIHLLLHATWRAFQFLNAPSLLQLVNATGPAAVPGWMSRHRWLYTAAMRRFWIEQLGDAVFTRPLEKLSREAQAFDFRVVAPLVGMPAQARAVSSLATWETWKSGERERPEGTVGKGQGLVGKLIENIASALHWFEEHLVLKGGGENLMNSLRLLGKHLTKIDELLTQPRYLLLMIVVTFVIIL